MKPYFHSVTLDREKCKGCTNCIKRCPTEAIRVRDGKAKIIKERCIDCGECIRVCPYHAKKATTDDFDRIFDFKYRIALVAPAMYAQFKDKPDVNAILTGVKALGFDDVFEVARAAELVTAATKELMPADASRPLISSACPAVMRLIRVRFPDLIPNVVPLLAPIELGAWLAKERAIIATGLNPAEIGVFFITPCAAKVTSAYVPIGVESSLVDGCIAMKDMYLRLLPAMKRLTRYENLATAGLEGIAWAKNGGEGSALNSERYIAVDGIWNVIKVLEEVENGKIDDIVFVEASACVGGCVGGPLTVENAFVAKTRIQSVLENTSLAPSPYLWSDEIKNAVKWRKPVEFAPVMTLDGDMVKAMRKLEHLEAIYEQLPRLDCGSCGAPSCHALAEDIVRGFARETDCVFKLRERVKHLAMEMVELEGQGFGQGNKTPKQS
ncbi:MAG: 4Fe-4S dicluster domain-containing protein [Clostridiales bacterium]|jgi:iron only hydrogenase large subunit-like protein|nr:4Fe-4S dicluster domain-containing protein [Clostridiales bacterium]